MSSVVDFESVLGLYTYNYTVQNDSLPADGLVVSSFSLPFFGNPAASLVAPSIVVPEFWSFEVIGTGPSTWPYAPVEDPGFGSYQPPGADYTDPDFVLRFFWNADPFELLSLFSAAQHAQAQLAICNLSDRCSDDEIQGYMATILRLEQYHAAQVGGGEALSGFAFDSLLAPTIGPVLLATTGGTLSYDTAHLPLTYGLVQDPTSAPEPATILLLGGGLALLVGLKGRRT
jgi:hypothetical protein